MKKTTLLIKQLLKPYSSESGHVYNNDSYHNVYIAEIIKFCQRISNRNNAWQEKVHLSALFFCIAIIKLPINFQNNQRKQVNKMIYDYVMKDIRVMKLL